MHAGFPELQLARPDGRDDFLLRQTKLLPSGLVAECGSFLRPDCSVFVHFHFSSTTSLDVPAPSSSEFFDFFCPALNRCRLASCGGVKSLGYVSIKGGRRFLCLPLQKASKSRPLESKNRRKLTPLYRHVWQMLKSVR